MSRFSVRKRVFSHDVFGEEKGEYPERVGIWAVYDSEEDRYAPVDAKTWADNAARRLNNVHDEYAPEHLRWVAGELTEPMRVV